MATPRTVIPLPDYERIFRIIFSVLDERANTPSACLFFTLVGAFILEKQYKLKANPVAGAAAYMVNTETATVATFGRFADEELTSSDDAFHCWIESNGVVIDFMAPLFGESMKARGYNDAVPERMFQKPRSEIADSVHDLRREGAFFLAPNLSLTTELFQAFMQRPANTDLMKVCLEWYRRPPKSLPSNIGMRDDLGNIFKLELHGPRVTGVW